LTTARQKKFIEAIKLKENNRAIMYGSAVVSGIIFAVIVFSSSLLTLHVDSYLEIIAMILLAFIMSALVALSVNYFVKYDEEAQTTGLTAWSIARAKEMFKGRKVNELEGKIVNVNWQVKEGDDETVNFSKSDMEEMKANVGDLVYLTDARKWMGGLKSVHAVYGEPHNETGIVYITEEHTQQSQFVKDKPVTAEKEM
ncbi:MAG: sodium:solute symporter family protein, partial [Ignavibacteriaceae bacterium]